MLMEEFNNQKKILEEESYRAIRRKISDFSDKSNNDEIAGFVKGVVALQSLLFSDLEKRIIELEQQPKTFNECEQSYLQSAT